MSGAAHGIGHDNRACIESTPAESARRSPAQVAVANGCGGGGVDRPGPRWYRYPALGVDFLLHGDKSLDRLFDRYGDVVWLGMPGFFEILPGVTRVALLRDPILVKPLFTAPDEDIDSTAANRVLEMLYGDRSLFLIDGPDHRRLRKLLLPRLRGEALEQWADFIVRRTECEARTWVGAESVRVHPRMLDVSLELILKITLGLSDDELSRWKPPMHKLLETAASNEMGIRYVLRRLGGLTRWRRFQRVLAECNELVFDEIARRRAMPDRAHWDLLDVMLAADGEPLTDKELRDQIFTILIAGHETSATTAAWAMERLIRTPAALEKAVAEARSTDERAYLEAVVHETLRLRPPVAGVGRVTRTPVTLGGYHFPANVLIAPVIRCIQRKHDLYADPDRFSPDRFLTTRPGMYTLIPFGGGPHRCLGDKLAIFQTTLVLRTILRTVDISALDARDEPIKPKAGVAYLPGNGALLRARLAEPMP